MQKGQASIEYLMIAGILLIFIGIAFFYAQSTITNQVQDYKAITATNKLADTINQVYALGPGTKIEVKLDLPRGIEGQIISDSLIGYTVLVNGRQITYSADTKASLQGTLPTGEGVHVVTLSVNDNGEVIVGTAGGISLTPATLSATFEENTTVTQNYSFVLTNNNDTTINNLVINVDGTIAPYISLPSFPTSLGANSSLDFNITLNLLGNELPGIYTGNLNVTSDGGNDSSTVQLTINQQGIPPTSENFLFEQRIAQSSDDAEERLLNNAVRLNDAEIELIQDGGKDQEVGFRFDSVGVPAGAIINSAYIEFVFENTISSDPSNIIIYGEDNANSSTFTTTSRNITNRTKTTANIAWSIPAPITDATTQTSDITLVVNEIVALPSWASGNPMTFILTGEGTREVYSYDADPTKSAKLVIDYNV